MAHWIEHQPANQKVAGSIPGQGISLGWGPGPQLGVCEKQPINVSHISMFLSVSFSHPLSLKVNKIFLKSEKKRKALAGMAQWIECWPANQRVIGSVPSQGTCLGCRPDQVPSKGRVRSNHTLVFLSFLPPFPSV